MVEISLPAQIVRTCRFTLGVPGQFTVTPDGASVLFLRSRAGHDPLTCLWSLDLGSGTEGLLADPVVLLGAAAGGGSAGAGIASYATDATATLAAFPLEGVLWTVNVATGQARRLPARPGPRCPIRAPTRPAGASPTYPAAPCG